VPVALHALSKLGDHRHLERVLPYLQRPEKEIKVAAVTAIAQLAGEQHAESVRPYIQQIAATADETVARAASRALQKLDGRVSQSGRFTSTTYAASPTPTSTPAPTLSSPPPTVQSPAPSAATGTARTLLID